MLELLTKSRIRRQIILLFLQMRDREYCLTEIAHEVPTSLGTAQRELRKLLALEFIRSEKKAKHNLYSLNHSFSLLNEVESIVNKTNGYASENKNS